MTQETTPADPRLDEWEKLANAATLGPWKATRKYEVGPRSDADDQSCGMCAPIADVYGENRDSDLAFIAAAREAIPALIGMVRERDTEIVVLRGEVSCAEEEMSELQEETGWTDIEGRLMAAEARATAAEARVKELEAALREIGNPLTVWRERAEADGRQLSGLAYQIAENAQTLKDIAIAALTRADS